MADRLESMAVFVKAAELGSFTRAGAALGISSQMVGRHVADLETRIGTELLRRTTRRQSLTSVGDAYLARCRDILAEVEAAETFAHDLGATPRGQLRMSAPKTVGAFLFAPAITEFLQLFPHVAVDLLLDDRYVDLVEEGYDVVLRLGHLKDSTLHTRALPSHRLVACAAPSYIAQHGMPLEPADLSSHECLGFLYSTGAPFVEWRFERATESVLVEVGSRFRTNDARVLLDAAIAGRGIILQAERIVCHEISNGRLIRVLSGWNGPERPMHLLYSPSRLQTTKLRVFINHLIKSLGRT